VVHFPINVRPTLTSCLEQGYRRSTAMTASRAGTSTPAGSRQRPCRSNRRATPATPSIGKGSVSLSSVAAPPTLHLCHHCSDDLRCGQRESIHRDALRCPRGPHESDAVRARPSSRFLWRSLLETAPSPLSARSPAPRRLTRPMSAAFSGPGRASRQPEQCRRGRGVRFRRRKLQCS
jgi:hypothetical protein